MREWVAVSNSFEIEILSLGQLRTAFNGDALAFGGLNPEQLNKGSVSPHATSLLLGHATFLDSIRYCFKDSCDHRSSQKLVISGPSFLILHRTMGPRRTSLRENIQVFKLPTCEGTALLQISRPPPQLQRQRREHLQSSKRVLETEKQRKTENSFRTPSVVRTLPLHGDTTEGIVRYTKNMKWSWLWWYLSQSRVWNKKIIQLVNSFPLGKVQQTEQTP